MSSELQIPELRMPKQRWHLLDSAIYLIGLHMFDCWGCEEIRRHVEFLTQSATAGLRDVAEKLYTTLGDSCTKHRGRLHLEPPHDHHHCPHPQPRPYHHHHHLQISTVPIAFIVRALYSTIGASNFKNYPNRYVVYHHHHHLISGLCKPSLAEHESTSVKG